MGGWHGARSVASVYPAPFALFAVAFIDGLASTMYTFQTKAAVDATPMRVCIQV